MTYRKPLKYGPKGRRPIPAARRAYLGQSRTVRVSTGRECQECFCFGFHAKNCEKGD